MWGSIYFVGHLLPIGIAILAILVKKFVLKGSKPRKDGKAAPSPAVPAAETAKNK